MVNVQKPKLLIFVGEPLALWHVKAILDNVGFNVGSLRAGMRAHDRDHLIAEFNDPNSTLQIRLTTTQIGGYSYNLQGACNHVLVLDVPSGGKAGEIVFKRHDFAVNGLPLDPLSGTSLVK